MAFLSGANEFTLIRVSNTCVEGKVAQDEVYNSCFQHMKTRRIKWSFIFQALLAGNRNTDGSFNNRGTNAIFWSSTESGSNAWNRKLNSNEARVNRNTNNKANGFSVRCVKD
ncbi:MAG: FISUMP domain-containing protein [Candidatus Anammoxibacter sp.]